MKGEIKIKLESEEERRARLREKQGIQRERERKKERERKRENCTAQTQYTVHYRHSIPLQYSSLYSIRYAVQSNLSLRPPDKRDHLKIADTHFQSLQFVDSNIRSAFLKMRPPEKCELRTPEVGPKLRFNLGKATTYVKLSEKHSLDRPAFPSQALRTGNHGVCKILLVWSLPPGAYGNYRSLMTMGRARACVQLHIEKFKTKPGK